VEEAQAGRVETTPPEVDSLPGSPPPDSRVAAVAAGLFTEAPACRPSHPIAVLSMHGTADEILLQVGPPVR
jgi:hypothetical protein